MKTFFCFALTAVVLFACSAFIPSNESEIYGQVVRLHILANSDGDYDQALKLAVRDAVIAEGEEIFGTYGDIDAVKADIGAISEKVCAVARETLDGNGCALPVTAEWGVEAYPTCEYDGVSFPAGEYYSLRINIGEGEGKNWWCVLFPPLCLSSSTAGESLSSNTSLSDGAVRVFTQSSSPRYVFRFKLLEFFGLFGN